MTDLHNQYHTLLPVDAQKILRHAAAQSRGDDIVIRSAIRSVRSFWPWYFRDGPMYAEAKK